ncbi:MAG: flagellar biosynthesis anti-sigma factor FlgM [Syntrophorhabdaceae bacterium]|nr:flagellar biosynthesis anti-sigma factor FlgM [Syntrophorhabdaceae bacterium]
MKDRGSSKGSDEGNRKRLPGKAQQAAAVLYASRLRRFEDICKAFKAGTYNIDGRQIAEKMVSDAVRYLREQTR